MATRPGPAASPGALGPGSSRRAERPSRLPRAARAARPHPAGLSRLGFPAFPRRLAGRIGRGRKGSSGAGGGGRAPRPFPSRQLLPRRPRPVAQAGGRCSVCSVRARAPPPRPADDPAFYSWRTRRTHTPPSGRPQAERGDAGANTHPAPGQGVPLTRGPPSHRTPIPTPPHPSSSPAGPGSPNLGRGNRPALRHPAFAPKPHSARTQGARLPPRPRPSHPRTGAVRSSGAEEGVSARWSPPHAPYRGFLDPFCPPGGARPPRRAHRDPAGRRGRPQSPTCVPGEASAGRAPPGCPLGRLREARGQPAHVRARVCVAPSPASGAVAAGTRPSQAPPASAPHPPRGRRRSQWPWGTSAQPPGLRGSNLRA